MNELGTYETEKQRGCSMGMRKRRKKKAWIRKLNKYLSQLNECWPQIEWDRPCWISGVGTALSVSRPRMAGGRPAPPPDLRLVPPSSALNRGTTQRTQSHRCSCLTAQATGSPLVFFAAQLLFTRSPTLCDSASAATSAHNRRNQLKNEWAGGWPAWPPGCWPTACEVTVCFWWACPVFAWVSCRQGDVPETPRRGSTTWMSDRIRRWAKPSAVTQHRRGRAREKLVSFLQTQRLSYVNTGCGFSKGRGCLSWIDWPKNN